MLVRLTFVKRFTKAGMMYLHHRVYEVDEKQAQRLCACTINDMPVFKVILPTQVADGENIINLTEEALAANAAEESGQVPEESVEDMEKRFAEQEEANKKALAAAKKNAKAKSAPKKKAAPKLKVAADKETNADMVT